MLFPSEVLTSLFPTLWKTAVAAMVIKNRSLFLEDKKESGHVTSRAGKVSSTAAAAVTPAKTRLIEDESAVVAPRQELVGK